MNVVVSHAGFLTSVQDAGRIGFRRFGISAGGALDSYALRIVNLLVENDEAAAVLEITLGGFRAKFEDRRVIAWAGGGFDVRIGSVPLPPGHAGVIYPGDELTVNPPAVGCRAWLAISGGIDVPKILESRSTDLRASFGGLDGRPLRAGDKIPLAVESGAVERIMELLGEDRVSGWSAPRPWVSTAKQKRVLRFIRGNEWNSFHSSAHHALLHQTFTVSPDSNRMGVRLEGPPLWRDNPADLISEGVAAGTIQIPPNAKPILLLGDCQTIGGYPRIGNVITVDLAFAAQLRPGDLVQFHEVSLADAHRLLFQRERDFGLFRAGLEERAA